jgi:hypothetical protein
MPTGPREGAPKIDNPFAFGLWHLPAEKGLSLRRSAHEVRRGRDERLRRDLAEPSRMARRFNVAPTRLPRRIRDDSWIAVQHIRDKALSALRMG